MAESEIRNTPHWYILQYPLNRVTIGTELQKAGFALEEEQRDGNLKEFAESLSEGLKFYAPNFFSLEDCKQQMSRLESSIFQNYVFVYGSQEFIYYLKKTQMPTLFFFRSADANGTRFPYVEQYVIDELKTLEKKNEKIPYIPFVEEVAEGDTIRITEGKYKDFIATAVREGKKQSKQIVLNVANYLVVPLCTLKQGSFEIIKYSKNSSKPYIPADINKHHDIIIEGLKHYHNIEKFDSKDAFVLKSKAENIINVHKNSSFSVLSMRCKHAAMMLYASTICQAERENEHYKSLVLELLQNASSDYDKALLYTTLFGCYMDIELFRTANDIVQSWDYDKCTKTKQLLLDDLKLFHEWYWTLSSKKRASRRASCSYDLNEKRWFMLNAWNVKTRLLAVLKENKIKHFCPASQSIGFKNHEMEILKDKVFAFASYNELQELKQENDEIKLVREKGTYGAYISYAKKLFDCFKKVCKTPADAKEILTDQSIISKLKHCSLGTVKEGPLKGVEGYITLKKETQQSKVFVVLDNMLAVSATLTE